MHRTILIVLFILAVGATPAFAGHHDGGFGMLDSDGDGVVTFDEYMSPFDKWDADNDGVLSLDEWLQSHGPGKKKHGHGHGHGHGHDGMAFKPLADIDVDGDGFLSLDEYNKAYPTFGGFDMIDTDNDGVVNSREWDFFLKAHDGMGKKY